MVSWLTTGENHGPLLETLRFGVTVLSVCVHPRVCVCVYACECSVRVSVCVHTQERMHARGISVYAHGTVWGTCLYVLTRV